MNQKEKLIFNLPMKVFSLLIISWAISLVSVTGFIGLLIFILLPAGTSDNNVVTTAAVADVNVGNLTATEEDLNEQQTPPLPVNFSKIPPVTSDDHILGSAKAKVTLIIYSDFECQFCSRYAITLKEVANNYKNDVRIVFRHFPLNQSHPLAKKSAVASECADEQGKFWAMHDQIFANQKTLSVDNLKSWALDLGIDANKFNICLDNDHYVLKIQNQAADGAAAGIVSTPSTFINGKYLRGEVPYDQLQEALDQILK